MNDGDSRAAVCSYNEWDPLEEVIVGSVVGAMHMSYEPALAAYHAPDDPGRAFTGGPFPSDQIARAQDQLDGLAELLSAQGVGVRRPDDVDHTAAVQTPDFAVPNGHGTACPRDVLIVIGDEIIEAPMAYRSRFFEYRAYRRLIKEYFRAGARWTTAPKPLMSDELYVDPYEVPRQASDPIREPLITEFEPCFDAACFARMGRDIFWQPDLVSNDFGAEWLQRHLGPSYRLHRAEFSDRLPQHIDTTLVPLRPGVALMNPDRPPSDSITSLFAENGWSLMVPPPSVRTGTPAPARDVSNWISLNTLSLDAQTVVVEAGETPMIEFMQSLGCTVLPCEFDAVFPFGGSFHCCTLDIRRNGVLESYFPTLD